MFQLGREMKGATAMHDNDFTEEDFFDADADAAYMSRQRKLDSAYAREYESWVRSLTPEDRLQLKELGLECAYLPSGSGGALKDAAESSRASCVDEMPPLEKESEVADLMGEHGGDSESINEILRRLIGELADQNNCRLSLNCLALVTGLSYQGLSMTEIADRHGVTRAAVSKRCIELTKALRLKPSRAMRSLLARSSYRKARMQSLNAHP
jgi:hypothetical protein